MNQRKKKIVATCMIVYMSTLALPQTPAHAHESDPTVVSQPVGEPAAGTHTELNMTSDTMESTTPPITEAQDSTPEDTQQEAIIAPEKTDEEQGSAEAETKGEEESAEAENGGEESEEPTNPPEENTAQDSTAGETAMSTTNALSAAPQAEVDYAKDLVIEVKEEVSVQTPTMTGQYESGDADTYEPGKDYSPTDKVTTGKNVIYDVAFSFGSMAETNYVIDKVEIVSLDEKGSELGLTTPIYWNNGGQTEQTAMLKDIKWGVDSGFVTGGTARMNLAVELPDAIYWNTQIAPRIKLVAYVGDTKIESRVINLPAVRLSSQAIMDHHFSKGAEQKVTYEESNKSFRASFNFFTGLGGQSNIIGLLDQPQYETQTYYFKVAAMIDKYPYAERLTAEQFIVEPGNGMILAETQPIQYDADEQLLAVTMKPSEDKQAPKECDTKIFVNLPHEWAGEEPHGLEHQVSVTLTPQEVAFSQFTNEALFIQRVGKNSTVAGSLKCPTNSEAAESMPWFHENIAVVNKELGTISHSVSFRNMNLAQEGEITIYQVLPHRVACLTEAGTVRQSIADGAATEIKDAEVLYGWSEQLMAIGQAGSGTTTNFNQLQRSLQDGTIPLMSYDDVLAGGHSPNIKAYRFKAPELANKQKVTYTIEGARYNKLPEEQMVRQSIWYEGHIISLVSLPIKNDEGLLNELKAGMHSTADSFQTVESQTYLNLGATKNNDERIQRFQAISVPHSGAPIQDYYGSLSLSIVDSDGKTCQTIDDYSQSYGLRLLKPKAYVSGELVLEAGTTVTFTLPEQLIPYLSVRDPYMISAGERCDLEVSLDREKGLMTLNLPQDLALKQENKDGIYLTMQFAQPVEMLQLSKGTLQTLLDGTIRLELKDSGKIMNGDRRTINGQLGQEDDNYLKLRYTAHDQLTLLAAEKDNQMLRLSGDGLYANGETVTFEGMVFNTTQTAHDYYAAFSVPAVAYNMAPNGQGSAEQGAIKAITAANKEAVVYYQTAQNASEADLQMMQYVYGEKETQNLSNYYPTIQAKWQPYQAGDSLPEDVIMFMVYQPTLAPGEALQVSYDVQMEVAEKDEKTYTNNAVMKYYSGGTTMEIWSNRVTISNIAFDPEKSPVDPDKPDVPDKPDIPDVPDTPDVPDIPDVPDVPDTPDAPDVPDTPVIPDTPSGDIDIQPTPTPLAPQPEVTIEDTVIPLAAQSEVTAPVPEAAPEEVVIADEDVPLAQQPNPHTGQENGGFWNGVLAALAGLGLSTTWLEARRKKEENK